MEIGKGPKERKGPESEGFLNRIFGNLFGKPEGSRESRGIDEPRSHRHRKKKFPVDPSKSERIGESLSDHPFRHLENLDRPFRHLEKFDKPSEGLLRKSEVMTVRLVILVPTVIRLYAQITLEVQIPLQPNTPLPPGTEEVDLSIFSPGFRLLSEHVRHCSHYLNLSQERKVECLETIS
jgi:hypothetical protein